MGGAGKTLGKRGKTLGKHGKNLEHLLAFWMISGLFDIFSWIVLDFSANFVFFIDYDDD